MSINDVGVPGQPLSEPALTAWQQAVVAVLGGIDTPVAQRFLALTGGTVNGNVTINGAVAAGSLASGAGVAAGGRVTGVAAASAATDAANKGYVDSRIWFGTQQEYNAISPKDPTVLYCIFLT